MAVLLSGKKLRSRLRELVKESERVDIAVAWATAWDGLDEVLSLTKKQGEGAVRILVGVGGHITSPMALRKIRQSATLSIYGKPDGLLFHPKLYIFHTPKGRICWVGSANLTWAAYGSNIEVVSETDDADGSAVCHFNDLWKVGEENSKSFDLDEYEKQWRKAAKKRPAFLKDESDASADPTILRERWSEYAAKLQATSDLERRIQVLDAGYAFVRRDWEQPLTRRDAAIMFGFSDEGESFAHFGALKNVNRTFGNYFKDSSDTAVKNRRQIRKALNRLIDSEQFPLHSVQEEALAELYEIKGCNLGLATRLLIFARPDWFVVCNKKSREWQAEEFKLVLDEKPSASQYLNLIGKIQRRPWWRSSLPENPKDRKLWKYRAALTDCFAFENYKAGGLTPK